MLIGLPPPVTIPVPLWRAATAGASQVAPVDAGPHCIGVAPVLVPPTRRPAPDWAAAGAARMDADAMSASTAGARTSARNKLSEIIG
ncbi:hypothetical protein NCCP691_05840 [Noviherbaspirillum aridicola]|uniref:Uncharacterized protein n=1 Tax=Noviherbaspirillum aridicola TaxID=2849687 RepID=A0ABQ4Q167_9BURK|nr:hypothetical protein NCCP691_05840 [Noviherbaspirillum aridicola]